MDLQYLTGIGLFGPRPAATAAAAAVASAAAEATRKRAAAAPAPAPAPAPATARRPLAPPAQAALATSADAGAAAEKRPKGTPLNGDASCFSVLSYNLLAPAFVRPVDTRTGEVQAFAAFEWAEPAAEVLDWEARRPRLLAELSGAGADVLCLQEVQFERAGGDGAFELPAWLQEGLGDRYAARLPGQGYLQQMAERNKRVLENEVAIGCAILYRTDRLEVAEDGSGDVSHPNTLVGLCVRGRRETLLEALEPTVVYCVHLDAQSEEKRVDQLIKCLGAVRQLGGREAVLAGDMNTECLEGSCVAALLADASEPSQDAMARECANALRLGSTEGDDDGGGGGGGGGGEAGPKSSSNGVVADPGAPTEKQLEEWKALWSKAADAARGHRVALSRVLTGPTRAAYDHGKSVGPCVTWRLDHLLYTGRTLRLRSYWSTLEADPDGAAAGLPNRTSPSDHLPVAAVFEPRPVPRLGAEEEAEVLSRLASLEAQQEAQREALQRDLDASEPAKPDPPQPPAADGGGGEAKKNKQKKKNERPSPEVQAFIQEKRRRTRALKEEHAKERATFVEGLRELELDLLESRMALAAWVETGPAAMK